MKELKEFFENKELKHVEWELKDEKGNTYEMDNQEVINSILNSPESIQEIIFKQIKKLEFNNDIVNRYLKFLGKKLIKRSEKIEEEVDEFEVSKDLLTIINQEMEKLLNKETLSQLRENINNSLQEEGLDSIKWESIEESF